MSTTKIAPHGNTINVGHLEFHIARGHETFTLTHLAGRMPSARYSGYSIAEAAELFALEIAPGTLTDISADHFEREIANYSTIADYCNDHGEFAYCNECDLHYSISLEGLTVQDICNACLYVALTTATEN